MGEVRIWGCTYRYRKEHAALLGVEAGIPIKPIDKKEKRLLLRQCSSFLPLPPSSFLVPIGAAIFFLRLRKSEGEGEKSGAVSVYSIVHECVHRPPFSLFCSFRLLLLFPGVFFAERKAKEEEEEEDSGHLESSKYGKRGVGLYFWWAWPCSSYGVTCQAEIPPSSQRGDEQHARTPEIHRQSEH